MNRDTLYSFAVVDLIGRRDVYACPSAGDRYLSVMVVNQDHYINRIFHEPGAYDLTVEEFDTPYVARRGADLRRPGRPRRRGRGERAAGPASCSRPRRRRRSSRPTTTRASLDATRRALLVARPSGFGGFSRRLRDARRSRPGAPPRSAPPPAGEACPRREALLRRCRRPTCPSASTRCGRRRPGRRLLVDLGLQRRRLLRAERPRRRTASTTSPPSRPRRCGHRALRRLPDDRPNSLPIMEGWNYLVRLYRPRREVVDGTWTPARGYPGRMTRV